jgi:serine/threonine-protein kinase
MQGQTVERTTGVRPGDVVAGKYRIDRIIGQGGMGVVVAAHHLQLDEQVAIKLLLPEALQNAETVGRFGREARAAVKIKSEHVARVIDVGALDSGSPYMVMEYLEGSDLAATLASRGPLPVTEAVSYLLQACEAIAEAHALGIIHRDIKPANLFLANRPSGPPVIKVLDFGISKSVSPVSQAQLTKTSAVMGSPLYMSPEQMLSSKSANVRSDIWALGVVLYELLVGAVPFQGDTMPELVAAVLQRDYEPVRRLRPDIPPDLDAVVSRCLLKDPEGRFADVGELASALAAFAPAQAQTTVSRVEHVLMGSRQTIEGALAPRAVIRDPRGLGVSPIAATLPGDASEAGPRRTAHQSGSSPQLVGSTTTEPAVSMPMSIPGVRASRWRMTGLLAVALAVAGIGFALTTSRTPTPYPSLASAAPTEPHPSAERPPASAATASPAVDAAHRAMASTSSTSVSPPASAPTTPAPRPRAAPLPRQASCDPPYTLDSANHRIYKPECLGGSP